MLFHSFAKLNLHLEVLGRRADGYHELRTVFQTIDLADRIRIEVREAPGVELEVRGDPGVPAGPENLARRAADAFLAQFRDAAFAGATIELDKRIPTGGGLGGGSSNAATVLLGLALLARLDPFSAPVADRLTAIARELGADVPFFLVGGCALGLERGDRIVALPDPAPPRTGGDFYLASPPFGLATADVFHRLAPIGPARRFEAVDRAIAGETVPVDDLVGRNDLEAAAFALSPPLAAMYTSLVRGGAGRVRMSGSGSTLFAHFADAAAAEAAAAALPHGVHWFRVSLLGREAWRRAGGFESPAGGS